MHQEHAFLSRRLCNRNSPERIAYYGTRRTQCDLAHSEILGNRVCDVDQTSLVSFLQSHIAELGSLAALKVVCVRSNLYVHRW